MQSEKRYTPSGNTNSQIECFALHSKPKNHKNKKGNTKNPKVGGIMGGYANLLSA